MTALMLQIGVQNLDTMDIIATWHNSGVCLIGGMLIDRRQWIEADGWLGDCRGSLSEPKINMTLYDLAQDMA